MIFIRFYGPVSVVNPRHSHHINSTLSYFKKGLQFFIGHLNLYPSQIYYV